MPSYRQQRMRQQQKAERAGERHYGNGRMAVKEFISETFALKKKKILIYCAHKKELF